jgi:hypothetical protein
MLVQRKLATSEFHVLLIEVCDKRKCSPKSSLAKAAMACHSDDRLALYAIPDRTTCATTLMHIIHSRVLSQRAMTANVVVNGGPTRVTTDTVRR